MTHLPWVDAEQVTRLLPLSETVTVLENALAGGLDPLLDPPRVVHPWRQGHLLLMPSESAGHAGVKVTTVAAANPQRGLPRIQAVYVLFDDETLSPLALIDGTALTSLRTPALSAVAVRHLAVPEASRLVLFGTGPQAWGHLHAVRTVRSLREVVVVGRDTDRTAAFAAKAAGLGLTTRVGGPESVADADVVVCATSAGEPLLPGHLVPDQACVIAVGSHEPDRRELDAVLMGRATVVVEDTATALREAGDVVCAVSDGSLDPSSLVALADVARGRTRVAPGRPRVFKSVGMAWEDLVVAAEIQRRLPPV